MKTFLLGCALAVLGALAVVPADAQTAAPGRPATRAEVQAELLRARAAGELDFRLAPVLGEPAAPRRARPADPGTAPVPAATAGDAAPAPPRPAAGTERLAATR
jgi:hypothetical protein